jgi:hypothetical protein
MVRVRAYQQSLERIRWWRETSRKAAQRRAGREELLFRLLLQESTSLKELDMFAQGWPVQPGLEHMSSHTQSLHGSDFKISLAN